MKWLFVILCLLGNYLNIKKLASGFIIFGVVDSFFCYQCIIRGEYEESIVFIIYALTAIWGFSVWSKVKH